MISIVGTRIYMREGESVAFRAMYRCKGELVDFNPNFILTMNIKDRESNNLILSKVSETFTINDAEITLFIFNIDEPIHKGDYLYDVIVETTSGASLTTISDAPIHILQRTHTSVESTLTSGNESSTSKLNICTTPLVCDYRYVEVEEDSDKDTGTLILFNSNYEKE